MSQRLAPPWTRGRSFSRFARASSNGMFVEHWDELNLLDVFQQIGAIPPLDAGPAGAA